MDLSSYFKILNEKKSIFSSNNILLDRKIKALQIIRENGYPSLISSLIPYLKSDFKQIRELTLFIIKEFLAKIDSKKQLYETLRYANFSINDFVFFKNNFTNEQYLVIIQISSQNRNGFIREKSVDELIEVKDGNAIRFLILRLSDWVESIRDKAEMGIVQYKKTEFLLYLIQNLYLFEKIEKVERVNLSQISNDIFNFIIKENENYVLENFSHFSEKERIILAKKISCANEIPLSFKKIFLSDKNFIVRSFALKNFELLENLEIENLINDNSSKIRLQTLYEIEKRDGLADIAINFIDDNSKAIRELARFTLNAKKIDFATIYIRNLKEGKNVIGSIFGLSEIQSKESIDSIIPYLNSKKISFAKSAFAALTTLDSNLAFSFALENLDTNKVGLRNLIIKYFEKNYTNEVLEKARFIYKTGDFELRKGMLKLFNSVGRYFAISDLMIGTIDENPILRSLSGNYIEKWILKIGSYFIEPNPNDIKNAKEIYKVVSEILVEKKYFNKSPLENLNFYFK